MNVGIKSTVHRFTSYGKESLQAAMRAKLSRHDDYVTLRFVYDSISSSLASLLILSEMDTVVAETLLATGETLGVIFVHITNTKYRNFLSERLSLLKDLNTCSFRNILRGQFDYASKLDTQLYIHCAKEFIEYVECELNNVLCY